jgi:hypothetical protein
LRTLKEVEEGFFDKAELLDFAEDMDAFYAKPRRFLGPDFRDTRRYAQEMGGEWHPDAQMFVIPLDESKEEELTRLHEDLKGMNEDLTTPSTEKPVSNIPKDEPPIFRFPDLSQKDEPPIVPQSTVPQVVEPAPLTPLGFDMLGCGFVVV